MSVSGNHQFSSGSHHLASTPSGLLPNGANSFTRARTPVRTGSAAPETEVVDDDPRSLRFRELFAASEAKIEDLFRRLEDEEEAARTHDDSDGIGDTTAAEPDSVEGSAQKTAPKKSARKIDEDDYGDDDESEDDAGPPGDDASPLKAKSTGAMGIPRVASPNKSFTIPPSPALTSIHPPSDKSSQGKSAEDVRKSLEEDKKAAEEAVKRNFQLYFYTLDNDKENMLEQQKLEEVERQADMEMNGQGITSAAAATEGSLSQANLGASSLAFKYLIARVDAKRDKVEANDQQLRNLLVEVKKNRSKWASEDKIGQEELYEAAEKVLGEIKAGSEYSQPFLTKVNKREAPDYYLIIRNAMDLSTMTKKLKTLHYKSKKEFVDDLNQIWENCLKYNSDPAHPLRKNAKRFQKEVDRLTPLIPDVVVRDRADVEAEERRAAAAEIGDDNAEDSDDEPIIAARGRKAPGKKAKKGSGTAGRKAPAEDKQSTPTVESKPLTNGVPLGRADMLRADSEMGDSSQLGFNTPPAGTLTPAGLNGVSSQHDLMDVDGVSGTGPVGIAADLDYDDPEYKLWKQVTKRDRAHATAERNRLFRADRLDGEQPALLRSKAGMRKWVRQQPDADSQGLLGKRKRDDSDEGAAAPAGGETLAEGMEETEERVLPDYYDPTSAIPCVNKRLKWTEDSEGVVAPPCEEALRMVPAGYFSSLDSNFSKKMAANIRQMQDTRKICKKIEVVKQMQLQTQVYQNQFQKYEPVRVEEKDLDPTVVSDDGAIMNTTLCQATMRRSIAQICYAAGFEEYHPSALDALGELAMDYFVQLATSLKQHMNKDRVKVTERIPGTADFTIYYKPFYTPEEAMLLTLYNKSIDLPELHRYATEDMDKLTTKLGVLHERTKAHLAELLRPALEDGGEGGVNAFKDGSEQFVGGDFAEDLDEDFFGFKELGLDKEFGFNSLSVPLHLLQNRMHNAYAAQNANVVVENSEIFPNPQNFSSVTLNNVKTEVGLIHKWFENKLSHSNRNADYTDPATKDKPLTEDEDLPQKQRFPKPRLPPNGKISSPRKKPVREAGPGKGHPKKSMRYVDGHGWLKNAEADEIEKKMREDEKRKTTNGANGPGGSTQNGAAPKTPSKLRIQTGGTSMSRQDSRMTDNDGDADGDGDADADADGDEDDADEAPAPAARMQKNKDRPNGFISPVSIEAVG